jgi:cytochrome c
MTKSCLLAFFYCTAMCGVFHAAHAAGDAMRGETLYQGRCAACHSIDYNGVGPAHKGLFDRKAGSQSGYAYSPALQGSTVIWTATTLDKWLTNPEKLIPGQKMGFLVPSAKDRADLIAYLKKATVSN